MSYFDPNFESTRLRMLAQQHPEIVKVKGQIIFNAEEDEDRLSGTSWKLEEEIFDKITDSGFKIHIIELIDNFIEYRGQHKETPRKEGIIHFGDGLLDIEWLPNGSIKL